MTQNAINNSASELTIDNLFLDGNTLSSTDTNGNIILAPDGTGDVSVTAASVVPSTDRADSLGSATNSWDNVYADGLTFDDGSNILSAYEENTWTPVLAFGGASVGITYAIQTGIYTRIGRVVNFNITIILTNKGSSTGAATITLPSLGASSTNFNIPSGRYSNLIYPSSRDLIFGVANGTSLLLSAGGDNVGTTNITNANFNNNTLITFAGFYFLA